MPRPPRIHLIGALYYVSARVLEGAVLFRDARDYQHYLELLMGYREQFGFKLFAFVLLPDHLELCVELTGPVTISEIMHALNSRYTKYYNKRYGHAGHLFQERFRSTLAEKGQALLPLTGYVHTLAARSGVASDVRAYRWSSLPSYVAGLHGEAASAAGPDLTAEAREVLQVLACEHAGMTYEAYLRSVPITEWEQWRADLQQWVIGSQAYQSLVRQHGQQAAHHETALVSEGMPQPQPSVQRRGRSLAFDVSLALSFVSICAAWAYGRNMETMKQTLQAISREHTTIAQVAQELPQATRARLANFAPSAAELGGTSWDVQLRAVNGLTGASPEKDRLEFLDGKLVSRQLDAQGYQPSHYTMARRADGSLVWETMQTDAAGAVVHWRGETNGQAMHGLMTRQASGGAALSFNFVGVARPQPDVQRTMSEI